MFHETDSNLKLADILPILGILSVNLLIQREYRILPPYDRNKHIQYYINNVFGEMVGSVIWTFLGDDLNEYGDTMEGGKVPLHDDDEREERALRTSDGSLPYDVNTLDNTTEMVEMNPIQ